MIIISGIDIQNGTSHSSSILRLAREHDDNAEMEPERHRSVPATGSKR